MRNNQLLDLFVHSNLRVRLYMSLIIAISFVFIFMLVYATGGIRYVYSHTIYIPLILAALTFGIKGGLVVGLLGGLLLGPFMPVDTFTGEMQVLLNWLYRLFMLMLVGSILGFTLDQLRKQIIANQMKAYKHSTTNIKNYKAFLDECCVQNVDDADYIAYVIKISNYVDLVNLLGYQKYFYLLKKVYTFIDQCFKEEKNIYQVDNLSFWVKSFHRLDFDKLIEQLNHHKFIIDDIPLFIEFSVGVSFSEIGKACDEVFHQSEHASYEAANEKLGYVVYDVEQVTRTKHLAMLGKVPQAIENQEFYMVYHPIVDIKSNKTLGFEALIRWKRLNGDMMPLDFIPLLEETRLIDDLTEYIVNQVLVDYEKFKVVDRDLSIAINLSQRNLYNPALIDKLKKSLQDVEGKVFVEMTESAMMLNESLSKSLLHSLKEINVGVILDDFGVGYSSLSHLNQFNLDKVKLDQSFVFDLDQKTHLQYIVKTIILLAHDLQLKVVAEGIESETVLNILKGFGCDQGQGFYFAKAMPLEDAITYLKKELKKTS